MRSNSMEETHQIKSRWYYIFWGIMTTAVVVGQLYVALSYRSMSKSLQDFMIFQIIRDKDTTLFLK
jgi:hypothetical protein